MTQPRLFSLCMIALIMSSPISLAAEVVYLKNGNTLEGEVIERDDGQVDIEIPGLGLMTFSMDEIESIKGKGVEEISDSRTEVKSAPAVWNADSGDWTPDTEPIAEFGYHQEHSSNTVKESGVSIKHFGDQIIIREYLIPVSIQAMFDDPHPGRFRDRSARLKRSEYDEMWLQVEEQVDIWNLQSEPKPPADEILGWCEATFRRDQRSVKYVLYSIAGRQCARNKSFDRIRATLLPGMNLIAKRERELKGGIEFQDD